MPRSRTELGYRLGIAAGEGRLNEVQRLLAADADTEARVPIMGMMMSSLNAAAYTNHGQVVKVLIKAGADVNSRQSTGHTPLHCCAMEGQPGMMSDLLQAGADPTLASVEGQTALHTAAQWGHAREVKTLIAAGAKIEAQCIKGVTPLRLAVRGGNSEVVRVLLESGAKTTMNIKMPSSILDAALDGGNEQIIRLLLAAGADPDIGDREGEAPPLMMAVAAENTDLIRILTAAGANPNIITTDGATPVGLAVNLGLPNALTALFAAGGSPHLTVEGAPTPLQNAIIDMRPTCLALLLAAGADPEECHTSISPYVTAELKRLRPSYPPGTSGARMLQILAVAHAYDACSWRWPLPSTGDTASTNGLREGENTVGDTVGDTQGPEEEINALQTRSRPEVEAFKWRAATAQKNRVMQNAFGRYVGKTEHSHGVRRGGQP